MIFVAFFTKDTPYEQEIQKLIASLVELKLKYIIYVIRNQGSWQANTQYKAKVIQRALSECQDNICYVDADAIIRKQPKLLFTLTADIGVHYKDGKELLSGTIYLKNCIKIKELISRWIAHNDKHPQVWDQRTLAEVINASSDLQLAIHNLPAAYTQIFDTMKHNGKPVIEHFQASRKLKKAIDRGENYA